MPAKYKRLSHEEKTQHEKYQDQIQDWINSRGANFTHAITLNLNHNKISRYFRKKTSIDPPGNSEQVCEFCIDNLRLFSHRLAKSLYGNSWKRYNKDFVWIPAIEGFRGGEKIHFHCSLCVDEDRHDGLEEKITRLWTNTPYGSVNVVVEKYRDTGWIEYSTQCATPTLKKDIVWDCVLISRNKDNC